MPAGNAGLDVTTSWPGPGGARAGRAGQPVDAAGHASGARIMLSCGAAAHVAHAQADDAPDDEVQEHHEGDPQDDERLLDHSATSACARA